MEESIGKIANTLMNVQLNFHVSSQFMSKVYFGRGIMSMADAQCKELRRTYEKSLARKLGLGRNFPRKMKCGRVSAMGAGIVSPPNSNIIINTKASFSP